MWMRKAGTLAIAVTLVACSSSDPDGATVEPVTPPSGVETTATTTTTSTATTAPTTPATTTVAAGESPDRFAGFVPCDAGGAPGDWVCATLDVPIDRTDPGAGSIPLKVWARPHTDADAPPAEPVFAPPAGPGAYGLDNRGAYYLPQVLGTDRDIILLDARGTGESGVIDCPNLQDGFDDVSQWAAVAGECGAQLGDAADRYGAVDRAMDLEAVRDRLGYEQIVLYGHSFSGVDAQVYAARWPERLSAMVLDASFPLTSRDHWLRVTGLSVANVLRVADLACADVADCAERTDDPSGTLAGTVTRIAAAPLEGVASDGTEVVVDEAYLYEAAKDMDLPGLVAAAAEYEAGDPQPLLDYAAENPSWYRDGGYGDPALYSGGADVAGYCKEPLDPWDPSHPIDVRRTELDAAVAELPDDVYAPWSVAAVARYSYFDQCIEWPAPDQGSESAVPAGIADTSLPVLVLAGDRDRLVPPAQSRELLELFPNASFVVIPGADHPALSAGNCVARLIADFVETLEPVDGEQCG
jgi:pimeloyl-ACP methyl ester carboxylesterase